MGDFGFSKFDANNPFQVLGIPQNVLEYEVARGNYQNIAVLARKAHRTLAQFTHPDKGGDGKMILLQGAALAEILQDTESIANFYINGDAVEVLKRSLRQASVQPLSTEIALTALTAIDQLAVLGVTSPTELVVQVGGADEDSIRGLIVLTVTTSTDCSIFQPKLPMISATEVVRVTTIPRFDKKKNTWVSKSYPSGRSIYHNGQKLYTPSVCIVGSLSQAAYDQSVELAYAAAEPDEYAFDEYEGSYVEQYTIDAVPLGPAVIEWTDKGNCWWLPSMKATLDPNSSNYLVLMTRHANLEHKLALVGPILATRKI